MDEVINFINMRRQMHLAWMDGVCIRCKQPALPKCHTPAGRREYNISALCEECFDAMFAEDAR